MKILATILGLVTVVFTLSLSSHASTVIAGGTLHVPLNGKTVDFEIKSIYLNVQRDQFAIEGYSSQRSHRKYFSIKLSSLKKVGIEPASLSKLLLDSSLQTSLFCTVSGYAQDEKRDNLNCNDDIVIQSVR